MAGSRKHERIDAAAHREERRGARRRLRIAPTSVRRIALAAAVYVVAFALVLVLTRGVPDAPSDVAEALVPAVVAFAFLFETMDSAAGMGFGTALAPLLFAMGYEPLQVVPVLLVSESFTGLVAGLFHHEFRNVEYSLSPMNTATRTMLLVAALGMAGAVTSAFVAYYAFPLPEAAIRGYVAGLLLLMAGSNLVQPMLRRRKRYRPRRIVLFAAAAGLNKGMCGGGYGPVVSLGAILSGLHEKTAAAIASMAEGLASLAGAAALLALDGAGVEIALLLLPSVFLGGFAASVGAPYLVRVVPRGFWRYAIPAYAVGIAVFTFIDIAAE